jgi:hypothetical protein
MAYMAEQHPASNINGHTEGVDILKRSLAVAAEVVDTNGRYNLAVTAGSFDVVQLEDEVPIARFLIVDDDAALGEIETKLEAADIETLQPGAWVDKRVFYSVPIGAKLLANERFFPSRESTETYVSDEELCTLFGGLWRRVYGATGQIPAEAPMKRTGMLEFSGDQTRLFPIPPYAWTAFERLLDAKEHFLTSVSEELLRPDSAAGDYERLINAAGRAWEEG